MKNRGKKLDTGNAAITDGCFGRLKCRYIIHAVGPSGDGEEERRDFKTAIEKVLFLAEENKLKSIAIPSVASGVFGFPKDKNQRYHANQDLAKVIRIIDLSQPLQPVNHGA